MCGSSNDVLPICAKPQKGRWIILTRFVVFLFHTFFFALRSDKWRRWEHCLFLARMQPLRQWQFRESSRRSVSSTEVTWRLTPWEILTDCSPRSGNMRCRSCDSAVDEPDTRMQLEVFLSSPMSDGTIKVKVRNAGRRAVNAASPWGGHVSKIEKRRLAASRKQPEQQLCWPSGLVDRLGSARRTSGHRGVAASGRAGSSAFCFDFVGTRHRRNSS